MTTSYKCEICKHSNATFRSYKKVTGMLMFSFSSYTAPQAYCDKHKSGAGWKANVWNLFFGWWALHAFFWNIFAIISNARGGKDVTKDVEQAYNQHVQNSAVAIGKQMGE